MVQGQCKIKAMTFRVLLKKRITTKEYINSIHQKGKPPISFFLIYKHQTGAARITQAAQEVLVHLNVRLIRVSASLWQQRKGLGRGAEARLL